MNEGCSYLYLELASAFPDQLHVIASLSQAQKAALLFLPGLLPRDPVSTEAGAFLDFIRLRRSCRLDSALPLTTGIPCFATQTVYCATLRTPFICSVISVEPSGLQTALFLQALDIVVDPSTYEILYRRPANKKGTSETALYEAEMQV